jgi:hypothetical protein
MSMQVALDVAFALAGALGGFVLHALWAEVRALRERQDRYVLREDFQAGISRIEELVQKIFDRLDRKQDKV